jgi:hypothetical protein
VKIGSILISLEEFFYQPVRFQARNAAQHSVHLDKLHRGGASRTAGTVRVFGACSGSPFPSLFLPSACNTSCWVV